MGDGRLGDGDLLLPSVRSRRIRRPLCQVERDRSNGSKNASTALCLRIAEVHVGGGVGLGIGLASGLAKDAPTPGTGCILSSDPCPATARLRRNQALGAQSHCEGGVREWRCGRAPPERYGRASAGRWWSTSAGPCCRSSRKQVCAAGRSPQLTTSASCHSHSETSRRQFWRTEYVASWAPVVVAAQCGKPRQSASPAQGGRRLLCAGRVECVSEQVGLRAAPHHKSLLSASLASAST